MMVIVPDVVSNAINKKIDEACKDIKLPDVDRENIYSKLLGYFNDHGHIPDFKLEPVIPIKIKEPK